MHAEESGAQAPTTAPSPAELAEVWLTSARESGTLLTHISSPTRTARPARFAKQLVSHMGHKVSASWDAGSERGIIVFNRGGETTGFCELTAADGVLHLRVTATTQAAERLTQVVQSHLERFATRDELEFAWAADA